MSKQIDWHRGDRLLARRLQEMADEIRASRTWHVSGSGVRYAQSARGHALYVNGGLGGVWTGVIWFGNSRTDLSETAGWPDSVVTGEYLLVNLRDGSYSFTDDYVVDADDTLEQVFHVATSDGSGGYTLNTHTQGDIHARIT